MNIVARGRSSPSSHPVVLSSVPTRCGRGALSFSMPCPPSGFLWKHRGRTFRRRLDPVGLTPSCPPLHRGRLSFQQHSVLQLRITGGAGADPCDLQKILSSAELKAQAGVHRCWRGLGKPHWDRWVPQRLSHIPGLLPALSSTAESRILDLLLLWCLPGSQLGVSTACCWSPAVKVKDAAGTKGRKQSPGEVNLLSQLSVTVCAPDTLGRTMFLQMDPGHCGTDTLT